MTAGGKPGASRPLGYGDVVLDKSGFPCLVLHADYEWGWLSYLAVAGPDRGRSRPLLLRDARPVPEGPERAAALKAARDLWKTDAHSWYLLTAARLAAEASRAAGLRKPA